MSKRYIVLGDGRRIGLGRYVAAWKACLKLPPKTWIGLGISGTGERADEAIDELRRGLADRINRHIPGYGKGRKWAIDWYSAAWRIAWNLNGRRIVTYERDCPKELRARLAHRFYAED